jgi:hypothetical protein
MKTRTLRLPVVCVAFLMALGTTPGMARVANAQADKGNAKIAEEAFIYGFPMVMNYAVFYEYFIDKSSPAYKAPLNQLYNTARVYTPQDTTIVTPNSDTPYSFVAMDLRAEPYVICNPEIEKSRYFSVMLVDMYTFNYGYAGSRATGNGAVCNMIAGPGWKGEKPEGIANVFRSETDFSIGVIRTQLFNAADIENVKKIQAGYRGVTLSQFQNKPAPPPAPEIAWPKIDKKMAESDPFAYLNFVLQFCPPTGPAEVEVPLRARFAKIGIVAGKPFGAQVETSLEPVAPADNPRPEEETALEVGMKSGLEKIKQTIPELGKDENGWRVALNAFGDRQKYAGNWTLRAAAAMAGIYGNSPAEAVYPLLATDSAGQKADCSTNRYTLTFPDGQLPPANAFWSVTMYDGKTQLLIDNPINRYLINAPMLPDLKKNADGSLTIYMQKDSPGADKESNWLPAPNGPIYVVMRIYWPKEAALDGSWKPPAVQQTK